MSKFKYMNVLILPILAYLSFNNYGWITFSVPLYGFVVVPVFELFFQPNSSNLSEAEEELRKNNPIYDWQVYLMVPIQCLFVSLFLVSISQAGLSWVDKIGRIMSMGMMCGVLGINVAHELGHRKKKGAQFLAKVLLLTSLYMHFFIEHNRGHHKNVGTDEDPSSARFGETVFGFWFRSVVFTYLSAWKLEAQRLHKKGVGSLSMQNEMLIFQMIQAAFLIVIAFLFGWEVLAYFILAAVMGFLLLETVNYIEHYGLERKKKGEVYERVMPNHSWNSNHVMGRLLLFELSRHSDHHYIASRKYQILRNIDESPQMPTGYPGMMLMALVPPLWFSIMNPRIKKIRFGRLKAA